MRLVIVSGLSGAGKSTVMKILEDDGFYCVDNLPFPLVSEFIELSKGGYSNRVENIAVGIDVRGLRLDGVIEDESLEKSLATIRDYKKHGYPIEIIYMEASSPVLIKRYKETRRIHPLLKMSLSGVEQEDADSGVRVGDAIELERKLLKPLREEADIILDSSSLLVRDLKQEIDRMYLGEDDYSNFYLTFVSFGYKYGIPTDADLVFDVRFLPNPYYVDELKHQTGNDPGVEEYVMDSEAAGTFLGKLTELIDFLIPNYRIEGKTGLVIAIGCTGGKHRSVTMTNKLFEHYKDSEFGCKKDHRDILR